MFEKLTLLHFRTNDCIEYQKWSKDNFEHVIGGRKYIKPRKWIKVNSACISSTWKGLLHILYWIKVYIPGYIIWYVAYKLYDMAYIICKYIFQIKGCAFQHLNWIARLDSNLSRLMKNSFQVWGSTISLLGIVPSTKKVLEPIPWGQFQWISFTGL